jgi:DNA end-binding protein Ku
MARQAVKGGRKRSGKHPRGRRTARAIWKGVLKFGSVSVPVKLYSAVEDRRIDFDLLHERDRVRIRQKMVHPGTGKALPYSAARRGYEIERGEFVILNPEELEALEPEPSRDLEVLRFLEPEAIPHPWYVRPYYLGPDQGGAEQYFALVEALEQERKEGLVRWVMRGKEHFGALRVEGGYLLLNALRHSEAVIAADELPAPGGRELSEKEVGLARQLMAALEGPFRPEHYRDEHRARVQDLIEAKRQGRKVKVVKFKSKPAGRDLAGLLSASLARRRASGGGR